MTVPSFQFLVFALLGAAAFNISSAQRWRELVWLVLNLGFIATLAGGVTAVLPLAAFVAIGYISLRSIIAVRSLPQRGVRPTAQRAQWVGTAAVVLVLTLFIWLKRYSFIPSVTLLSADYMTIGLSYVFFRVLHLVIDAGQGAGESLSPVRYLNFTLNFPAFISGPIQRYDSYAADSNLPLDLVAIGTAAWRIVLGAFKVLILSEALHNWQRQALAAVVTDAPLEQRASQGALAVVLYALFLYANFSGYTDFVIGVARLYRLRLPENFDRPFAATNFIEFWGRWHISLSQWLRSYVFNPLLMGWMRRDKAARGKQYPAVIAFFVTFFLVGAWHGQTSEFLFFGLLQGGGVAGNRLYQVAMARRMTPVGYASLAANGLYRAVARGLTFTWFAFTLLWFWSSWRQVAALASAMGVAGGLLAAAGTIAAASLILAVPDILGRKGEVIGAALQSRYARSAFVSAMMLAIGIASLVLHMSSPEIVYKQF